MLLQDGDVICIIKGDHRISAYFQGILSQTVSFDCMIFKIHQNCYEGFSLFSEKFHPHMTIPSEVTVKRNHKTVPSYSKTNMIGHNGHKWELLYCLMKLILYNIFKKHV